MQVPVAKESQSLRILETRQCGTDRMLTSCSHFPTHLIQPASWPIVVGRHTIRIRNSNEQGLSAFLNRVEDPVLLQCVPKTSLCEESVVCIAR